MLCVDWVKGEGERREFDRNVREGETERARREAKEAARVGELECDLAGVPEGGVGEGLRSCRLLEPATDLLRSSVLDIKVSGT